MSIKKTLAFAAIAASAFAAQAQNIVVNGSFEDTLVANGNYVILPSVNGWTGNLDIEVRNNIAGAAQDGVNYVELDTTRNSSMSQIITGNGLYEFSFYFSPRERIAAGSNGVSFSFGSLAGTVANVNGASSGNVWQKYTQLVSLNGATTLKFSAVGTSDSLGGSIDNVSVTAVPEPETYAMMLAGLGLMGAIARRRKAKAA